MWNKYRRLIGLISVAIAALLGVYFIDGITQLEFVIIKILQLVAGAGIFGFLLTLVAPKSSVMFWIAKYEKEQDPSLKTEYLKQAASSRLANALLIGGALLAIGVSFPIA